MTVAKGSRGWLLCWSPRRNLSAVWVRALRGQRKVRSHGSSLPSRWRMTGGIQASGVNSFPVVKLSSLALVTSKQLPQDGKEEEERAAQRDSEMPPKAERSEESGQPLWAPCLHSRVCCLCCVWLLCSPKAAYSHNMHFGDWHAVELSRLKECAHPSVRVPLSVALWGRDFRLCMWLVAGQISFSEIMKTRKGNLFPCEYQLHDGGPR